MSKRLRRLLSVVLAAALLVGLARWGGVGLEELVERAKRLPLEVYALATLLHLCIYYLRAMRFRALLPRARRPAMREVLAVSSAHNLASCILPVKLGEVTWVLYLKRTSGVPAEHGLATLALSRLLDLVLMLAMLGVSCFALVADGTLEREWAWTLGLPAAVGSAGLLVLSLRADWAVVAVQQLLGVVRRVTPRRAEKLAAGLEAFRTALRSAASGGRLWRGLALSVPLWVGTFGFFTLLASGFEMAPGLTVIDGWFGCTWALLANLLPVNGLAGAGTQELGWVVGFGLLGVPKDAALSAGLGVHAVHLFNVVALGLAGHVGMGLLRAAGQSAEAAASWGARMELAAPLENATPAQRSSGCRSGKARLSETETPRWSDTRFSRSSEVNATFGSASSTSTDSRTRRKT